MVARRFHNGSIVILLKPSYQDFPDFLIAAALLIDGVLAGLLEEGIEELAVEVSVLLGTCHERCHGRVTGRCRVLAWRWC